MEPAGIGYEILQIRGQSSGDPVLYASLYVKRRIKQGPHLTDRGFDYFWFPME